jgi:hypothetical protein
VTTKSSKVRSQQDEVFSLNGAARHARLTRQTLSKHLDQINHRRLPGKVLITRSALERWLEGYDVQEEA